MTQVPDADLVLVNGRITTLSLDPAVPAEATALAVRSGHVLAVGSDDEVQAHVGPRTRVVDVGGRRVVPGLVDSHVHFMRAGRTWADEVRWEDKASLAEALAAVAERAAQLEPGAWIRVIGGWSEDQFAERRGPTREELDAAAPENPVFVQALYEYGVFNSAGIAALGLDEERIAASPTPDAFERDADGAWNGRGNGRMAQLSWFYNQLPPPPFEREVTSTGQLSREFARLGLVGATDGGGVNSGPDVYGALHEAWRRGLLRTRVRMLKHATRRGTEAEDFAGYARFGEPRFGDGMLKWSGIGEIILYRSHDDLGKPADFSPEALAEAKEILLPFARKGWAVQIHVMNREFLEGLLDLFEEIHAEVPIDTLRWSLIHANAVTAVDIPRLKALGIGVLHQALLRFNGQQLLDAWGPERVAGSPALRALLEAGVPVGLGSDGMRASSYNPWASLQHFITGLTVGGTPTLAGENLLSREEALAGYSRDTAWFSSEEHERGQLVPGFLADVAVLSEDYFEVPVERIPAITSELTLLGGDVVWSSGAIVPATD
nr:amidohydrolase family protein [uncultured Actinotalea sp.]